MNNTLGYIHFWITFLSTCFLLLPKQYVQLAGMPRRYYDYSDLPIVDAFYQQNIFVFRYDIFLVAGAAIICI
jgi:cytochrome c oxidase subunit 1